MRKYGTLALVVVAAAWLVVALVGGSSYSVKVVLGSATNLVVGFSYTSVGEPIWRMRPWFITATWSLIVSASS